MRIRFIHLSIQCRESVEDIPFSPRVTFFHGETGAGKSSIARMIDFCLGGGLEQTPAVRKEVITVSLTAQMGDSTCVFERQAQGSNQIHVTWTDSEGEAHHVLAPIKPGTTPIVGDSVFNVSDLIFQLCGVTPIKVRRNKSDQESPLIRLSFRDLMWYCYLEQDKLDSSFYRLKEPIVEAKSRDVMRFVVGYYTERLQELEIRLEQISTERAAKIEACRQMRHFLEKLGYNSDQQIQAEIEHAQQELEQAKQHREGVREGFAGDTHFADQLREKLRKLSGRLGTEQQTLADLEQKVHDEHALKAELTTARFKLARKDSASSVLKGVLFESCPMCGTKVDLGDAPAPDQCPLCKSIPAEQSEPTKSANTEVAKRDIEARIDELSEAIERARRAARRQQERVARLHQEKAILDQRLVEELRDYDSAFVAAVRELDRQVATLVERLNSLHRLKELPDTIERLTREADESLAEEERIRREMEAERATLTSAGEVVGEVENAFLEALQEVGVPGVGPNDTVHISRRTWIPMILEEGVEEEAWSFFDTGSGGKKTLLNVCYALAVHRVAAQRELPLPTFLMIDTPMKNISEDVNRDLFESFYRYLYHLVENELSTIQVIIIDKDYIPPPDDIESVERFMTPENADRPPLISYYRGP